MVELENGLASFFADFFLSPHFVETRWKEEEEEKQVVGMERAREELGNGISTIVGTKGWQIPETRGSRVELLISSSLMRA